MVELFVVVAALVVLAFFRKQIKAFAYMTRTKVERRVPISAKIERTIKDLKRKREDYGFTLKDLYKSEEVIKQQIKLADRHNKKERVVKLKETLEKIESQIEEYIKVIKKIN